MNDPHVQQLRYRLGTSNGLKFKDPEPISDATDIFDWRLEDAELTLTMKQHFASEAEAKQAVSGFLRNWEMDLNLRHGRDAASFSFIDIVIVDRDPPPPGSPHHLQVRGIESAAVVGTPSISVERHEYPAPPQRLMASPDVETLWTRYQGYRDGHEPLLSMAYFCLTVIETPDGRDAAAQKYCIDLAVLRKLGELTSTRGDESTARKANPTGASTPLTPDEEEWIRRTVLAIIRRVGEYDARGSATDLSTIQMNNLPNI